MIKEVSIIKQNRQTLEITFFFKTVMVNRPGLDRGNKLQICTIFRQGRRLFAYKYKR